MINSRIYKSVELFMLFILLPVLLTLSMNFWIKAAMGVLGFCYVVSVLLKVEKIKFKINPSPNWNIFWKLTALKLVLLIILSITYMALMDKEHLFHVLLNNPKLWVFILLIYSFLSVYPQELIYRTFFFARYQKMINGKALFLFLNAIVFSLGHLFFRNSLVLLLTFIGGMIFAFTFSKTKSTLMVSIEHAIYGCWLFTVGMGSMLGFPQ